MSAVCLTGLKHSHSLFKEMFMSYLRFIRFTQNVFYLSGSEVSLNIILFNIGFHSCLSAGLGGQPADHMELLGLQLSRPQSKFNLLLPSCFPYNCTVASHYGLLRQCWNLTGETTILLPSQG